MIKIEIPNKDQKKKEFFDLLKPLIKERAELMLLSLGHLNGGNVDVNEGNLIKYNFITRKIINKLTIGEDINKKEFAKPKYKNTINDCLNKRKNGSDLENVNFIGFSKFLFDLLNTNKNLLYEILVCEASDLKQTNDAIIAEYILSGEPNKFILSQIFNYELDAIGDKIKFFFRKNNFVKFCPYCNITEVNFISTPNKTRIATFHQIDHFFDKSNHPMLACSFFNLVPSDSTCNGAGNKGSILFTDQYHLNPYIRGFNKDLVYYPLMRGNKVSEINIRINSARGTEIRQQMLGSSEEINEDKLKDKKHEEGNVNVFTLNSKYRCRTSESQRVLESIMARDNGVGAIKNYLKKMKGLNITIIYKKWYKVKMHTSFEPKEFNENAYSKFNRDIHDYYYEIDKKQRNKFIRDIIN